MKTITIFITDGGGQPSFQAVPSDGVDPVLGIRACRYGEAVFQQAAVDAEVARRMAELEAPGEQEADDD